MAVHLIGFYRKSTYALLWLSTRRVFRIIRYGDVVSANQADPVYFVRWISTDAGRRLAFVPITAEENRLPVHLKALLGNRRTPSLVLGEAQEYLWADCAAEAAEKGLCVPVYH